MSVMLSAALAFAISIAVHLALWRVRKPRRQYLTLVVLCAIMLTACLSVMLAIGGGRDRRFDLFVPQALEGVLSFALLYAAAMLAHIVTYSAVQADSPSLVILLKISARTEGTTRDEIQRELTDDVLVVPRLADLVTSGLTVYSGDRYVIQPKGIALARVHLFYRALLRLEKGG